MPHTHAGRAKFPTAGGACRNAEADRAPRRGHVHLRALDRLREGDRQREFECVTVAAKHRVRLHSHFQEQVAGRPAARSRQALASEPHPRTVRQPLRDRHADRFSLAVAIDPHVALAPFDRQLEWHLDAGRQILTRNLSGSLAATAGTAASTAGSTTTAGAAKHVGKAAGAAEETLQIDLTAAGESARTRERSAAATASTRPATARTTRPHALERTAVAVIHLPLARIVEHVEGRLHLLELLLRRVVVGMKIRMVLPREFAIGLANVLCRCRFRHAERLIVVFRHRMGSGEMGRRTSRSRRNDKPMIVAGRRQSSGSPLAGHSQLG